MPSRYCFRASRPTGSLMGLALLAAPLMTPWSAVAQENPLTQPPGRSEESPAPFSPAPSMPRAAGAVEPQTNEAEVRSPSATEIIRSLAPFADGNPNAPRDQRDVDADGRRKVRVDYRRAIDLTVFFRYDSTDLTAEAKIQLEPLGNALRSRELSPYRFLVAGHTDAAGDPHYNLDLSRRRAEVVRRYLIMAFDIAPSRLLTRGWGAGRLKDAERPLAGVNRRVEVALIVPVRNSNLHGRIFASTRQPLSSETPANILGSSGCLPVGLVDPRHRLASNVLDDFGATPTDACDVSTGRARLSSPLRFKAWYDPRRGTWIEH